MALSAHVLGMPTDNIMYLFCLFSPLDLRLYSPREVRRYNLTFPRLAHLSLQKRSIPKTITGSVSEKMALRYMGHYYYIIAKGHFRGN